MPQNRVSNIITHVTLITLKQRSVLIKGRDLKYFYLVGVMQDLHAHMNMATFLTTCSYPQRFWEGRMLPTWNHSLALIVGPSTATCLRLIDGPLSLSSSNKRQLVWPLNWSMTSSVWIIQLDEGVTSALKDKIVLIVLPSTSSRLHDSSLTMCKSCLDI